MVSILGLDIGGANTKACHISIENGSIKRTVGHSIYYEMWKEPQGLTEVLKRLKNHCLFLQEQNSDKRIIALTMTAELCDTFPTKEQGVLTIVDLVKRAFPDLPVYVWTIDGEFLSCDQIRSSPSQAAAANWLASAAALANSPKIGKETVILADMGSTTTDLIPICNEKVVVKGKTDSERLVSGELVYTGLLRTPISSLTDSVYLDGSLCRLANEFFAVTADLYLLLGLISEKDYDITTPDGADKSMASCARRVARMVSSEVQEIGMDKIMIMAHYLREKQIQVLVNSICQIISQKEIDKPQYIITASQGDFILQEVARRLSLPTVPWWRIIPEADSDQIMTAYCTAWLFARQIRRGFN